jgi:hypothetical protein
MAVAMTANGMFRELALKRIVSSQVADVLSALIGIGLIAEITRVGFGPMGIATTRSLSCGQSFSRSLRSLHFSGVG